MLDTWQEFKEFIDARAHDSLKEGVVYDCILDTWAISEDGTVDISNVISNKQVLNKLLELHKIEKYVKYSGQRTQFWKQAVYANKDIFADYYLTSQKRWCIINTEQSGEVDDSDISSLQLKVAELEAEIKRLQSQDNNQEVITLKNENERLWSLLNKYKDFYDKNINRVHALDLLKHVQGEA
jgi:hypothetical protein